MGPFEKAAQDFIDNSKWLTTEHQPGIVTMLVAARYLDKGGIQAAMLGQYNMAYRDLLKRAPVADKAPDDPLEAMLS